MDHTHDQDGRGYCRACVRYWKNRRRRFVGVVFFAIIFASLGGFSFGMRLAAIGGSAFMIMRLLGNRPRVFKNQAVDDVQDNPAKTADLTERVERLLPRNRPRWADLVVGIPVLAGLTLVQFNVLKGIDQSTVLFVGIVVWGVIMLQSMRRREAATTVPLTSPTPPTPQAQDPTPAAPPSTPPTPEPPVAPAQPSTPKLERIPIEADDDRVDEILGDTLDDGLSDILGSIQEDN